MGGQVEERMTRVRLYLMEHRVRPDILKCIDILEDVKLIFFKTIS